MPKIVNDIIARVDMKYEQKIKEGACSMVEFLRPEYCKVKITWYVTSNATKIECFRAIKKGYSTSSEHELRIYYTPQTNTINEFNLGGGGKRSHTYDKGISVVADYINAKLENAKKYSTPIHKAYQFAPAQNIFTAKDTVSINGFCWAKIKPVTMMPDGIINESEICNPDKEVYFLVNFQLINKGQLITGQMLYDGKDSFIPVQGSGTKRAHHKYSCDRIGDFSDFIDPRSRFYANRES